MATKEVAPSVRETAFCCPYCGAFTTQHWMQLRAEYLPHDEPTPIVYDEGSIERISQSQEFSKEQKESFISTVKKILAGYVLLEECHSKHFDLRVLSCNLSKCYNCDRVAVWVYDKLVYPPSRKGPEPNHDLPDDITVDYDEARSIADPSPRGAAALLRLAIQKLCKYLGESGKNIDADIARLVAKGLNPVIQQSLDIVRVIGNEAVHPGTIDLKDDRDTANHLFVLINSIADQMITHPKKVEELYGKLPALKREAIEKRDGKSTS